MLTSDLNSVTGRQWNIQWKDTAVVADKLELCDAYLPATASFAYFVEKEVSSLIISRTDFIFAIVFTKYLNTEKLMHFLNT